MPQGKNAFRGAWRNSSAPHKRTCAEPWEAVRSAVPALHTGYATKKKARAALGLSP